LNGQEIIPIENGNGRWARLVINIHLKKNGMSLVEWPEKLLLESSKMRRQYLSALRDADNHDFQSLVLFHQSLIRKK